MTIYDLKPAFQNLLRPLMRALRSVGFTPNSITILACFLSIVMGVVVYLNPENNFVLLFLPFFLFFRMALNAIDGMMAKEYMLESRLGGVLNEICDIFSDGAIFLAFVAHPLISGELIFIIVWLATATEVAGLSGLMVGGQRRFDGPMGKSDRAFVFGLIAIFLALFDFQETFYFNFLLLIIALLILTIFNRAKKSVVVIQKT